MGGGTERLVSRHDFEKVPDVDLLAFREVLQQTGVWNPAVAIDDYFSDSIRLSDFVPPLGGSRPLDPAIHPRNFALLIFGREPIWFLPGAWTRVSFYDKSQGKLKPLLDAQSTNPKLLELLQIINLQATWTSPSRAWTGCVLPPRCQHASPRTISVVWSGPRTAERVPTVQWCHWSETLSQAIRGLVSTRIATSITFASREIRRAGKHADVRRGELGEIHGIGFHFAGQRPAHDL